MMGFFFLEKTFALSSGLSFSLETLDGDVSPAVLLVVRGEPVLWGLPAAAFFLCE